MRFDTPRSSVLVAQSRIESGWLLKSLSGDLTKYMLIVPPILSLPIWLAVVHGLRPLRQLSEHIRSRSPDDLTPVGVAPPHAELVPLVAALDDLLARLLHKVEGERIFVVNAAHELRTPLAVISAQAHVLAEAESEQQRSEARQPMHAAIAGASHLIHQLLVLAHLEMAQSAPAPTAADVAQLVREEISHFVPAALARNMEISLEGPETLLAGVDVHALKSVLQNLIDNAVRCGNDNGRIVVELSIISAIPDIVVLVVADDGPGIQECAPFPDLRQVLPRAAPRHPRCGSWPDHCQASRGADGRCRATHAGTGRPWLPVRGLRAAVTADEFELQSRAASRRSPSSTAVLSILAAGPPVVSHRDRLRLC